MPRRLTDANLRLSEVSIELLAWDKHRTLKQLPPAEAIETDALIDEGANCHLRLLRVVHGETDESAVPQADEWLHDSQERWKKIPDMTERSWPLYSGRSLRVTPDDVEQLYRLRPDRSFSRPEPGEDPEATEMARQLASLRNLHAAGLLTKAELHAAEERARRIGGGDPAPG
ncbi:MAG: hypothetical protein JSS97_14110 [Actinobacteria bacterium]|nr:hypothetical protein [Actinomycetota bacterium]